jgi:hypothetical protein
MRWRTKASLYDEGGGIIVTATGVDPIGANTDRYRGTIIVSAIVPGIVGPAAASAAGSTADAGLEDGDTAGSVVGDDVIVTEVIVVTLGCEGIRVDGKQRGEHRTGVVWVVGAKITFLGGGYVVRAARHSGQCGRGRESIQRWRAAAVKTCPHAVTVAVAV